MNLLKLENCYSWLLTDNAKLRLILWQCLRFREHGYFHNVRYKMRLWDGFKDFFNEDTGRFLTGLLPEIKLALKTMNQEYETDDRRTHTEFKVQRVDENFLDHGTDPVTLRDYQIGYINQAIVHKRGIIYAPTSAGKTHIMIGILAALQDNTPTLVLANRKSLVEQNYDEIDKFGFKNVGRFYGARKDPNVITCATVQSAHLLKPLLPKIKCLIVDEIHEMMSRKPRAVYALCKNAAVRIGMSATPFKFGEKDLCQKYEVKGYIGPVFTARNTKTGRLTTADLQKRKFLSSAECVFRPIHSPELPYHTYQDAVTEGIAQNEEFHQVTKRLADKLEGRILILVERLEHGDRLAELIKNSVWVQGKDNLETRKYVIERLKEEAGKVVAIATSGIFNTGINVFVHHLVNCASGQAEHQIIQRFGRGLRVADDKDTLHYHDWYFTINDYLEKHSAKRIDILCKEGHQVTLLEELDV